MRGRSSLHRSDDSRSSKDEEGYLATYQLTARAFLQDVFIIPDGASGALAELERRKFTTEEGVRISEESYPTLLETPATHVFLRIISLC